MTLDRWKGIMDQVHTDTFNMTFCELHTTPTVTGWIYDGFGGEDNDAKMKWFIWITIVLFLFAWIYFGNFVFKNLVTGVVVNTFLAHR